MNGTLATEMLALGYIGLQVHEILNRRPMLQHERDYHEGRFQSMKNDAEFMKRWRAGDRAAVLEMKIAISGRALPLAKSMAEVEAWQRKNSYPPR
jgi:hypothetical protein